MLEKVKLLLDINDDTKDDLLTLLIDQAIEYAIDFTHNDDILLLTPVILKMVVYDYNRLPSIGLESESYSGVSFNYSGTYPDEILKLLKKKTRIIVL